MPAAYPKLLRNFALTLFGSGNSIFAVRCAHPNFAQLVNEGQNFAKMRMLSEIIFGALQ
jgi:hypothetical protein